MKEEFLTAGPFEVWGKGVGEAIKIWDVRGSESNQSLRLPSLVPGLKALSVPVPITYKVMRGKQIGTESYSALLTKLSETGAELKPDRELETFSPIEVGLDDGL